MFLSIPFNKYINKYLYFFYNLVFKRRTMKKSFPLIFLILYSLGIFISAYFSFDELGLIKPLFGILMSLGAIQFIENLKSKPTINLDAIEFNPSEFPKYVAVFIIQLVGFSLFHSIYQNTHHSESHMWPFVFIGLISGIPGIILFITLIINKNDSISFNQTEIIWKDNKEINYRRLEDIVDATLVRDSFIYIFQLYSIELLMRDHSKVEIPTYRMNFTKKDILLVIQKIKASNKLK